MLLVQVYYAPSTFGHRHALLFGMQEDGLLRVFLPSEVSVYAQLFDSDLNTRI